MSGSYEPITADLGSLVQDPPWYLPVYWTPAEPPPCSEDVMARVLVGLWRLDPRAQPSPR